MLQMASAQQGAVPACSTSLGPRMKFVANPGAPSEAMGEPCPAPTYHPLSGLPRPGYMGALTDLQQKALVRLRLLVQERGLLPEVECGACVGW